MSNSARVKKLLEKRDILRKQKNFARSDALRKQIEALGFLVNDEKEKSYLEPIKKEEKPRKSFLILFGSGEISPIGRKIHETVFWEMKKDHISIGLVTSPAGFQPNVRIVHEEIARFFKDHLTNFHPTISIIYANTPEDANNPKIAEKLEGIDYFFIGPGSPTYAVKVLQNSLLLERLYRKIQEGASLCLASAATLAFSRFTLPVYEIYKAGADLHWVRGLDIYPLFSEENLCVIPHYNNTEGGRKLDTSYCYMGKERFQKLRKLLPVTRRLWGIDEQTAIVLEKGIAQKTIFGKGNLHVL